MHAPQSNKLFYGLPLLGLAFYNTWVLGIFLNWPNFIRGAYISELEIHGQAYAGLFRVTDIIGGCLWICSALLIIRYMRRRWQSLIFAALLVVLSTGSITDSLLLLDCSESLDLTCRYQTQFSSVHQWHFYESCVVAVLMVSLVISIMIFKHYYKQRDRIFKLTILLASTMLIWGIDNALRWWAGSWGYGHTQRLFEIVFAVWFIYYWRDLWQPQPASKLYKAPKRRHNLAHNKRPKGKGHNA